MIFKIRHEHLGGHIHCRLFAAKSKNQTYATCGNFVVREEEFEALQRVMPGVFFEAAEPIKPMSPQHAAAYHGDIDGDATL